MRRFWRGAHADALMRCGRTVLARRARRPKLSYTYFVKQLERFSSIESHLDALSLEAIEYHTRDSLLRQPFPWIEQVIDDMKKLPSIQILETSFRALWDIALLNIYAGSTIDGVAK